MIAIYCHFCEKDFEGTEPWELGKCPNCDRIYEWDECCTEDYSDCWPTVIWEE